MNIVFVTPEFLTNNKLHDGGLASYLFKISKGMQLLGHEVTIIYAGKIHFKGEYKGIRVVEVAIKKNSLQNIINGIICKKFNRFWEWVFQSYELNLGLKRYINDSKQKIDIIQYSSYKAVALFAPANIPYVIRLSSLQRLWEKYEKIIPTIGKNLIYELEEYVLIKSKYVYGPGLYLANIISHSLKKKTDIEILPTPVLENHIEEDESLYNDYLTHNGNSQYLLYFGTISYLKGAEVISELIPEYLRTYPNMRFLIIGKYNTYFGKKNALEIIYEKLNVEIKSRLFYFSSMERAQLIPFIKNAGAIIIPSQIDNFPNTALEAMQYQKIVFASNRASLDSLISHGINGYICKHDDPMDYMNSIVNYFNLSESTRQEMSLQAQKATLAHSLQKASQQLVQYFEHVISNANNK